MAQHESSTREVTGMTKAQESRSIARVVSFCCLVMSGALLFGMDSGTYGGFMAMEGFLQDFGYFDATTNQWNISASTQNAITMVNLAGSVVACFLSGYIGPHLGRRWGLFITGIVAILGVLLQVASATRATLILGRFFAGAGIGFSSNFVTVYNSEVAPFHLRTAMIGLFQTGCNIAVLIGACVDQGTHLMTTRWSYRIPLIVQLFFPCVVTVLAFFIPDTPRWYLTKDRDEDAVKAIKTLRGPFYPEEQIQDDIKDMKSHIEMERKFEQSVGYLDLFRGTDLRRTHISCGMQVFQQWSGITFVFTFVTYFYSVSGITDSFTATMITDACQLFGSFIMFPLLKYVGRRTIMLWGGGLQTFSMLCLAIIGTAAPGSPAAAKCLVAFSCIYAFAFAFSWGPVAWALTTEISSNTLRSKTQAVASMVSWGLNLVITAFLPYLINSDEANIGSKVGYIFGGTGLIGFIWTWWFLPETMNRSLEELDELFLNRVSVKDFPTYKCTGHVEQRIGDVVETFEISTDTPPHEIMEDKAKEA